ncbi:hypothetical protein, partial [Burkholderia gladioli]|uniref:hypothetical protein n=1 Tax=Burkholderia gladioli TaxID=28095 RepID=UPI001ABA3519
RSLQRVASAQRPEILLAARVSPTGKFSNLSVTACPVMQGQVHRDTDYSLNWLGTTTSIAMPHRSPAGFKVNLPLERQPPELYEWQLLAGCCHCSE